MKTIRFFQYILLVLLSISFWSCDDYLNTLPKGQTIPKSVKELEWLLNDMNRMTSGTINTIYMGDDVFITDQAYASYNLGRPFVGGYAGKRTLYAANENDFDWSELYKQVWTCNYVLENIDEAPLDGKTEFDRDNVKGEALAARATAYLFLVNTYGKQYDVASATQDLAVPIVLTTDPDQKTSRASVAEVYNQIEADLDMATELVQKTNRPDIAYHFSEVGIYAIQARLALFKLDYDKALVYAQKVLEIENEFWDYNDFIAEYNDFINGIDKTSFVDIRNRLRGAVLENDEVILMRHNKWVYANKYLADFKSYFDADYAALFSNDDLRLRYYGIYNESLNKYEFNITDYTVLGVSVPEMILTIAEVHARKGNIEDALKALNQVTIKRYEQATYVPSSAVSADETLQLVLEERYKELMFTGMRWFDIRRLILSGDYSETIERTVAGIDVSIAPELENYIVNIPDDIIDLNPGF